MTRSITAMLCFLAYSVSAQPSSGLEVVRKMHEAYKGRWYTDLTFKQQSLFYRDGKLDREETWYEAIKMPKGLVIKFVSKDSGSGLLFSSDTQYVFRSNLLVQKTKRVHELLVLGFEVYFIDPAETARKLKESGFNMDVCAVEEGPGGKQYVVGDTTTGQFWITADSYLFTKLKRKDARGNTIEVQFNKYEKLGGGWIAPEVVMLRNGQLVMKEVYSNCSVEKKLPDSLFNPATFGSATW